MSSPTWLDEQKELLTRGFERVRDEAIVGLEKELKRRDEEHKKELKKKDDNHQILFERFNEEILKNAYLTESNGHLKSRLEKLEKQLRSAPNASGLRIPPNPPTSSMDPGSTVSLEEFRQLAEKLKDLTEAHKTSVQRVKYLERKNVAVMQKNKEMKESVVAWQKYSDRLQHAKEQKARAGAKTHINEDAHPAIPSSPQSSYVQAPPSSRGSDKPSAAVLGVPFHTEVPSGEHMHGDVEPNMRTEPHRIAGALSEARDDTTKDVEMTNEEGVSNKLGSSQVTEDEVAENPELPLPPGTNAADDDAPQIISERSLKRKRTSSTVINVYADRMQPNGTNDNPVRVKEEPNSSSGAPTSPHKLLRNETLDLDLLGPQAISTPHRKRLRGGHPTVIGTPRNQRSTSEPLIKEEAGEGGVCVVNNNPSNLSDIISPETRAHSESFAQTRDGLAPLRALDVNARTVGPLSPLFSSKRLKKDRISAFRLLTESGEEPPPLYEDKKRQTPESARAKFNNRLKLGKNERTPVKRGAKTPTSAPSKLNVVQTPVAAASTLRAAHAPYYRPGSREAPQSESRPGSRTGGTSDSRPIWPTTRKVIAAQPQPQPQAPLRHRPVEELKLSDFKTNPAYKQGQGYSYAFAETVRKRGDRACLPGCTRAECCGSTFRTLAAVSHPLTSAEEETLLEDYLGDAYDTMQLTQMSPGERQELVLQARTRELANKHGRHRQAYERHTTPPGFWRVDFPSTQEQQEDKEKAVQLEKKMVKERRVEAMRKGGRWIFRDE